MKTSLILSILMLSFLTGCSTYKSTPAPTPKPAHQQPPVWMLEARWFDDTGYYWGVGVDTTVQKSYDLALKDLVNNISISVNSRSSLNRSSSRANGQETTSSSYNLHVDTHSEFKSLRDILRFKIDYAYPNYYSLVRLNREAFNRQITDRYRQLYSKFNDTLHSAKHGRGLSSLQRASMIMNVLDEKDRLLKLNAIVPNRVRYSNVENIISQLVSTKSHFLSQVSIYINSVNARDAEAIFQQKFSDYGLTIKDYGFFSKPDNNDVYIKVVGKSVGQCRTCGNSMQYTAEVQINNKAIKSASIQCTVERSERKQKAEIMRGCLGSLANRVSLADLY